jgi:hypothetical protein
MPASAQIVRYKDSQALGNVASDGKFFDWVKERVRPAVAGEPTVRVEMGTKLGPPAAVQSNR